MEITTETEGATIRYTTDGSLPSLTIGNTYNGPLTISNTTVIRATAYRAGFFPTNIDTHSYLFPADIRNQYANGSAPSGWPSGSINGQIYDYAMDSEITNRYSAQEMKDALTAIPSAMITTDVDDFTNSADGIYSNPDTRGLEIPANLEIIGGANSLQVSARCGLRVRGGSSRSTDNPKHAFRLFFKEEYGDSKLRYPLFEEKGVEEFDKLDFRTAQNYSWSFKGDVSNNTFLREILARDLQAASGQPYTRSRYHHLYLNGIYWGLFMSQERAEANWGSSYLGGDSDDFDTIKSSGSGSGYDTEATDSDINNDWRQLWLMMRDQAANPSEERYLAMQGLDSSGQRDVSLPVLLDVDNLIDYMLILGYTGAYDTGLSAFAGASNNWFPVRNTARDERGFVHLLHDAEHSLGTGFPWNDHNDRINTENGFDDIDDFSKSNPQFFHVQLAQSTPAYRERFADRAHAALFNEGHLTTAAVLATLEKRRQVVDAIIIAESARWGDSKRSDPADKEHWQNAVHNLTNTIINRHPVFLGHLRQGDLYPDTEAPTFSPFDSRVALGESVSLSAAAGTIYYTTDGTDPRLPNNSIHPNAITFDTAGGNSGSVPRNSIWSFDDSGLNRGSSLVTVGHPNYQVSHWKHPAFNTSSWSSGAGILGFGELGESGELAAITTAMGNGSGNSGSNPVTSYLRHSFVVAEASSVISLAGEVLADDGVIVYLNGVEVHRNNLPNGEVSFDDTALTFVGGADEQVYQFFTLDPTLLQEGANVVAVEVHQIDSSSSDLGFDLSLTWTGVAITNLAITAPLTLKARTRHNDEWSALVENTYTTGAQPTAGSLLISEVHYHPANPNTAAELATSNDDSDFEFIELTNISSQQLDLKECALAEQVIGDHLEGVRFLFQESWVLESGEKVVVASDRSSFLARYPTAVNALAGTFSGNLGNSGEWLRLRNGEGETIASFRYNDAAPWPLTADGDSFSLQLASLQVDVDYSDPLSWIALTPGGSPGVAGPGPFIGAAMGDLDSNSRPTYILEVGSEGIYYTTQRDPEAFGYLATIEHSLDLISWAPLDSAPSLDRRSPLPAGTLLERYLVAPLAPNATRDFFRLDIQADDE